MSHLLVGTVSGEVKLALCHEREDYTCKGSSAWGCGVAIFLKHHPQHPNLLGSLAREQAFSS